MQEESARETTGTCSIERLIISVSHKGGGSQQLYYHDLDCLGRIQGHTTRAPPLGFELATDGIQFCAIANLDKTSLK